MRRLLNSFAIAFSMYSRVPMPQVDWSPENMRDTLCFFPLVGGVIGGLLWGWLWLAARLGIGAALAAAVATALPVVISGGIHLDGFCDTADALASHAARERKLEILKDPHVGAFAVIGCVLYLLLDFGLWSQHRFSLRQTGVVAVGFLFSRALSGLSVVTFPCAKTSGLAAAFADRADKARVGSVLLIGVWLCAFAMLWLAPVTGGACLAAALGVFFYYKRMAVRQFGGITGDLAGYFLQLCEGAILAAAVLTELVS